MSVQTQINRLRKASEDIGAAIRARGVLVPADTRLDGLAGWIGAIPQQKPQQEKSVTIKKNGTTEVLPDSSKVLSKVTIHTKVPTEIPPVPEKEVNFYDYDGSCRYSYTLEEFQKVTALPPLPQHPGLIAQEWNYTLEELKQYNRPVSAGATYRTDDGRTRLYIRLKKGALSPMLGLYLSGTTEIDWGDGSPVTTMTGTDDSVLLYTEPHGYPAAGDYVISLFPRSGNLHFGGENGYSAILRSVKSSAEDDCRYLTAIRKVEIGENTQFFDDAFRKCYAMETITLPKGIGNFPYYVFRKCSSLQCVILPRHSTYVGDTFVGDCCSLKGLIFPHDVDRTIGSYCMRSCQSLRSVVLPEGLTEIRRSLMEDSTSISQVVIPGTVTALGDYAFYGCSSASFFDFSRCRTIPSFGAEVFEFMPPGCQIRVPAADLEQWKAATNISAYADQMAGV